MSLLIGPSQALGRDMGVELCGCQRGVAEHLLNRAQVGPALKKVGGHRVAQAMWPEVGSVWNRSQGSMHGAPHHPRIDAAAAIADKHRSPGRGADDQWTRSQPGIESPHGGRSHGGRAFLSSLAEDAQQTPSAIDVAQIQTAGFRNADARGVQHFQNGRVTQRACPLPWLVNEVGTALHGVQHCPGLVDLDGRWQPPVHRG